MPLIKNTEKIKNVWEIGNLIRINYLDVKYNYYLFQDGHTPPPGIGYPYPPPGKLGEGGMDFLEGGVWISWWSVMSFLVWTYPPSGKPGEGGMSFLVWAYPPLRKSGGGGYEFPSMNLPPPQEIWRMEHMNLLNTKL